MYQTHISNILTFVWFYLTHISQDLDLLGPGGPGPCPGEMLDILKGAPDRAESPPKAARWIDLASISKASLHAAAAGQSGTSCADSSAGLQHLLGKA